MRLLLVEDDLMIGETLLDVLRGEGFAVDWIRDGVMADTALQAESYDLVLLDLGLPKMDGLDVLKALRARKGKNGKVPVLIATARDATPERIAGLDAGADDYVLKPYDIDELLARIRALIRRSIGQADSVLTYQNIRLNPITHEATRTVERDGETHVEAIALSAREWAVLETLMARPGVVFSRAQIEEKLYSWKDDVSSNAIEVYIHGLRKKLGSELIQNVRGLGYVMPRP
jgi:DNA-binding response OmpR family regulator